MRLEYLHPIESNKYLSLETTYQLGGTNWGTGKSEQRGIYLHFTHVEIGDHTRKFSLYGDGNCKVFAVPLKRKSQKQMELFHAYVNDHVAEFIDAFYNNKQHIFTLIEEYKG